MTTSEKSARRLLAEMGYTPERVRAAFANVERVNPPPPKRERPKERVTAYAPPSESGLPCDRAKAAKLAVELFRKSGDATNALRQSGLASHLTTGLKQAAMGEGPLWSVARGERAPKHKSERDQASIIRLYLDLPVGRCTYPDQQDLRQAALRSGMKRHELASRLGLTAEAVGSWLRGRTKRLMPLTAAKLREILA